MHNPMNRTEMKRAHLSAFQTLRNGILFGKALEDVKQIERSIAQFGMIMPIIVTQAKDALIIMDGKKRLTALKRMAFAGTLPRSLVKIPYILADEAHEFGRRSVSILSSQDLYREVVQLKSNGDGVQTIANQLFLCRASVEELLQLSHLSDPIRKAFFRQDISFEQAHAFSTMPCKNTQTLIFMSVGPFAKVSEILIALKNYGMDSFATTRKNVNPQLITPKLFPLRIPHNLEWDRAA